MLSSRFSRVVQCNLGNLNIRLAKSSLICFLYHRVLCVIETLPVKNNVVQYAQHNKVVVDWPRRGWFKIIIFK